MVYRLEDFKDPQTGEVIGEKIENTSTGEEVAEVKFADFPDVEREEITEEGEELVEELNDELDGEEDND